MFNLIAEKFGFIRYTFNLLDQIIEINGIFFSGENIMEKTQKCGKHCRIHWHID